jgi:hypothetical protein
MIDRSAQRRKTTDHELGTPTDLGLQCHEGYHRDIKCAPGQRFRALHKEHEHPLPVSGRQFRDYHLLFEEQAIEILAMTGEIVERVRKVQGPRFARSAISRHQPLDEKSAPYMDRRARLAELGEGTSASLHQHDNSKLPAIHTGGSEYRSARQLRRSGGKACVISL